MPELVTYTQDGASRACYAVRVAGLDTELPHLGGRVPVEFGYPEDPLQWSLLPKFRVVRNDMTPAFERSPYFLYVGRAPAASARAVTLPTGESGYTRYETQWRATPFDIMYDLTVMGRRQEDAQKMLLHVLRNFKAPWFSVSVVDSLGDVREYDAGEISVGSVSDLADIADRTIGWTISFTVRAELDLDDTFEEPAFTGVGGLPALNPGDTPVPGVVYLPNGQIDPLYSRYALIVRTHVGIDPATWR